MKYPAFRTLCLFSFLIPVMFLSGGGCGEDKTVILSYSGSPKGVTNPNPPDGATDVPIDQVLSWECESDRVTHAVYFGTTSPGVIVSFQGSTSYPPVGMNYDTVYYWRVDTHSSGITKGEVWSFRTEAAPPPPVLPAQAANPNPPDAAQDVALDATLSWDPADNATGYSICFGTVSPPPFLVNQSETSYDPGLLSYETTYYWRIDAYNDYGLTAGNIWTFATAATPPIEDKLEWAKGIYGGQVSASDVAAFADGSIAVTGYYSETNAAICAGHDNEIVLPESGCPEMFLAKVNSTGAPVWATRTVTIGITPVTIGRAVDTYPDGSVIAVGWMEIGGLGGTITFGANEDNETSFSSGMNYDGFIAKYNSDGSLHWVRRVSGSSSVGVTGVLALPDGSCIATGYFYEDATFGSGGNQIVLNTAYPNEIDLFIARYNTDGRLAWARRAGGEGYDYAEGIDGWADGSSIITGTFGASTLVNATFGEGDDNETVLSSVGCMDIFIAGYNPDGTLAWAKSAGGTFDHWARGDEAYDVAVLDDGSSVITGCFYDNATFGLGELKETTLYSIGARDIFVAKYNQDGSLDWVKGAGNADVEWGDWGRSIDVISDGSIFVTGGFKGDAVFGLNEDNATTLQAAGTNNEYDIFIARYNSGGTLNWARRAGGFAADSGLGLSALSDGTFFIVGSYGYGNYNAVFGPGEANETTLEPHPTNKDGFTAKYRP